MRLSFLWNKYFGSKAIKISVEVIRIFKKNQDDDMKLKYDATAALNIRTEIIYKYKLRTPKCYKMMENVYTLKMIFSHEKVWKIKKRISSKFCFHISI